ncbi:hypothetical protein RI129_000752 [Pyrocoelia pectoralis]|uniref:Electron transfer flavoprotein subunit alpha n=1 Tax=Pyrocoelia pectoralis TaxID=417401 RepID=A0AAN7VUX7_9COLE
MLKFFKQLLFPWNASPKLIRRETSVLVVAEHNTIELKPTTLNTIETAKKIDGHVTVLVPGTNSLSVAKYISTRQGVARVLTAETVAHNGFPEENLAETILATQKKFDMTHIFASSSKLGNSVLPRVAAKLDVPAVTSIVDIKDSDTFVRPIYAGNAFMTLKLMDSVKVVTVKEKSSGKLTQSAVDVPIEPAPTGENEHLLPKYHKTKWMKPKLPALGDAAIVICGGRGLQTAENFNKLYDLCYMLNAAMGATKSAVDVGLAPRDIQIGQFGVRVAPCVYIGIGVSGEPYHIAAIKESKTIVAINNDPSAPIFNVADYGLVMDLFDAIPTIKRLISNVVCN